MKPSLTSLPTAFIIPLPQVNAISISGEEKIKYLQGQVTCDVEKLDNEKLMHGAHCTAKGKVLSCFRLFEHNDVLQLMQVNTTLAQSLKELQKFGVFAKVEIKQSTLTYAAVCGADAQATLSEKFTSLPDDSCPAITVDDVTLLYIAGEIPRYVLAAEASNLSPIIEKLSLPTLSDDIWALLEITSGIPYLANGEHEFVPQMLNMQAINGISFTKGCYLGQETVARMQYLGRNKKAMYTLIGNPTALPESIVIEKQLGENWRKAGEVNTHYLADSGELYIQAVLASDTDDTINFRLKETENGSLSLLALPYPLDQQNT